MPPFTSPLPPTSAPQGMAPPATDPRRSRSDEILDGAAELFAEYGYHGSSLRDISHQVGISHPGMLHHFASKDALLGGVIDRLEAHAQAALDRVEELCTDPEVFVRALAEIWHPPSAMTTPGGSGWRVCAASTSTSSRPVSPASGRTTCFARGSTPPSRPG